MLAGQVANHYRQNLEDARALHHTWRQLQVEVQQTIEAVTAQEAEARTELAHAYMPELSREALKLLEQLTGFMVLSRRDPLTAMAKEQDVLKKTVQRINLDERYKRRQYLVGPHGELTQELLEARSMLEPWEETAARYEQLEGFMELVEVGYDTPDFSVGFFESRYWRYWATGDRICEELELDDFGDDVLPAWQEAVSKRDPWREEVRRISTRVEDVHALVMQHDQALARLPRLPELYLAACVDAVAEFLETADYPLLDEWARSTRPDDRAIRMGLRRAAGLGAKLAALEELMQSGIQPMLASLDQRMRKYDRKITKYRRPKYAYTQFSERDLDMKFQLKKDKYHQRAQKLGVLVGRLHRYDDYDRFDLANPPELWFVEMTGKTPSSQWPSLRSWYDTRYDGTLRHDDWDRDADAASAVVAAAAARELDDVGYLS